MKKVNEGFNKFCGPAVLSILTGKNTDECAAAIQKINKAYTVAGVQLDHLLKAADSLGFKSDRFDAVTGHSLFITLTVISKTDGLYIVTLERHFVVIEVNKGRLFFCDNHTKEPIPAASSSRLMNKVLFVHRVYRDESYVEPKEPSITKIYVTANFLKNFNGDVRVEVERVTEFDITNPKREYLSSFVVSLEELQQLVDIQSLYLRNHIHVEDSQAS